MKSRLKGLLALTLSLIMVFALATNAWAMVWVSGIDMGDGTATTYYKNGDSVGALTGDANDYNAMLWTDNGVLTLTLNNYAYEGSSGITAYSDLTIDLIGNNTVTYSSDSGNASIFVTGDLTITSSDPSATLTADADTNLGYTNGGGIDATSLTIKGGTISATAIGTNSYGIEATNAVTISGGEVNATGGNSGISANAVSISGGEVTATGTNGDGIVAQENITISDGSVTAEGHNGIESISGSIAISGGSVTATGDEGGIAAVKDVSITGGTVNATGDTKGIVSANSDVTISNATVTAKAGNSGAGIAGDNIIISGDTDVTAGCQVGFVATTVKILPNSEVAITANDTAIIDTATLNMGDSPWYQWKDDNGQWLASSSGDAYKLTIAKAAGTKTLYIKPATSTGGGGGGGYAPPIYYPTITVDSPKTFDGGIGIYVAMTLLSATGGAYLVKKKD